MVFGAVVHAADVAIRPHDDAAKVLLAIRASLPAAAIIPCVAKLQSVIELFRLRTNRIKLLPDRPTWYASFDSNVKNR